VLISIIYSVNSSKGMLVWDFIITATALGLTAIGTSELLNGISNLLVIMVCLLVLYGYIVFYF
jgi:glycine betaine transporter